MNDNCGVDESFTTLIATTRRRFMAMKSTHLNNKQDDY